jgi:uncharacterized RDD family membrane protein YckC
MNKGITQGVFYDIPDLAGIGRRLLIVCIDALVLFLLFLMLSLVADFVEPISDMFWILCLLITFLYLAVLPATPIGTVGYMATGVRLVDLRGRQAALWQSTFRFGFLVFGPLNLLADIIWLGGDPNRQSIRDKFARTYVIRRNAVPAGSAPIRNKIYYMFTYNIMFVEVERPQIRK